jgi:hypothetical protein
MDKRMTPEQRLSRMRKFFEKTKGVLAEDYEYFTNIGASMLHAPTHQNKAARMSEEQFEKQSQEQSEMRSSDKIGG